MAVILNILAAIVGFFFKLKAPAQPSAEAVAARQTGAAETVATVEAKANVEVQAASAAGDAAARSVDSDQRLRDYERTDPNNRDAS